MSSFAGGHPSWAGGSQAIRKTVIVVRIMMFDGKKLKHANLCQSCLGSPQPPSKGPLAFHMSPDPLHLSLRTAWEHSGWPTLASQSWYGWKGSWSCELFVQKLLLYNTWYEVKIQKNNSWTWILGPMCMCMERIIELQHEGRLIGNTANQKPQWHIHVPPNLMHIILLLLPN